MEEAKAREVERGVGEKNNALLTRGSDRYFVSIKLKEDGKEISTELEATLDN